MKISLIRILILIILFYQNCFSQTEKKHISVGGHIIYSKSKSGYNISSNPQINYFFKNNFSIGVILPTGRDEIYKLGNIVPYTLKIDSIDRFNKQKALPSPVIKYYFGNKKFKFYLQASLDAYIFKTNISIFQQDNNKINLSSTASIGATYIIRKFLGVDICYNLPVTQGKIRELPLSKIPYFRYGLLFYF